jgi:membrane protease YdiL (CAAX protease family)
MTSQLTTADRAVIAVALVLPAAVTWLYFVALDGSAAWLQQGAFAIGKTVQFVLPAAWVLLVQRQRPKPAWPKLADLAEGASFGLLVAGLMFALYLGWLKPSGLFDQPAIEARQKIASFGIASPVAFIGMAVFYAALHSLMEEYYWRWFAFGQLARWVNLPAAVIVSSLAFTAHHVLVLAKYFGWGSPLTWLFVAGVMLGGMVWAALYHKSGSLWGPCAGHALVDAAIFAIGYDLVM